MASDTREPGELTGEWECDESETLPIGMNVQVKRGDGTIVDGVLEEVWTKDGQNPMLKIGSRSDLDEDDLEVPLIVPKDRVSVAGGTRK